ncbi:competence protein comGD [Anoxybacillus gonensis]|nr:MULTISPECIES: competence type IV pilus minor pilin ComGD [Anoxybacillus]AKS38897.1 competence protein comGD [Anoxybacillus gonensis]EMI09853.1 competence protein comGD [Anoxybacillus gonensis]KGP59998.1 competence protein comGD [Anoxybacillus gonensis]MCQ5364166.1 competence type IV pilus minor pilin ComGD [Anoxybacillus gonensis]MCX8045883.1 competence type IV pilus minor pilin ComGD [Anoxybacillus gonensis]
MNERGFTLIEMLIVLFVVTSIMSFTVPPLQHVLAERQLQYFLEQFQNDMLYAQQYAISRKKTVAIIFSFDTCRYQVKEGGTFGKELFARSFPSPFQFQMATLSPPLYYYPNGNVNKAGTLLVAYGSKKYKIVFQLGKGRLYAQKL